MGDTGTARSPYLSYVPHEWRDTSPKARHTFSIRGWDDGSTYADVRCQCGGDLHSEDGAVPEELGSKGRQQLRCPRCGRVYVVQVSCTIASGPATGDAAGEGRGV